MKKTNDTDSIASLTRENTILIKLKKIITTNFKKRKKDRPIVMSLKSEEEVYYKYYNHQPDSPT